MKTLTLVTCLLAISLASDIEILKEFYDVYASCLTEVNAQEWTPEVVKCQLQKDGLIDEQGVLKKEELTAKFDNIISDETNLSQAKELISTCYDQGYQTPGSNDDKLMTTIQCSMQITDYIDKLE
ncbi:uncharacterized protein [Anoplolepis gracilipes]|uniref:uncharacterized protein n=1 Tax=Anoplolepis gracilipes TaxID=354296 RepID=UPI003BA12E7D